MKQLGFGYSQQEQMGKPADRPEHTVRRCVRTAAVLAVL